VNEMGDLVVKHVRQTLQENQRQDVVLKLRGVERPADLTRSIPELGFESRDIEGFIVCHACRVNLQNGRNSCQRVVFFVWAKRGFNGFQT
jgi:hypothetical protein